MFEEEHSPLLEPKGGSVIRRHVRRIDFRLWYKFLGALLIIAALTFWASNLWSSCLTEKRQNFPCECGTTEKEQPTLQITRNNDILACNFRIFELTYSVVYLNPRQMCFAKSERGFSCDFVPLLRRYDLEDKTIRSASALPIPPGEVIFVTYSSANHFPESRHMLRKLRSRIGNKIVYYDLGLTPSQLDELKKICNLEVKRINYTLYPDHVRNLYTYAFKPVIIAETIKDHPVFWVMDTSVTFKDIELLPQLYEKLDNGTLEDFLIRYDTGKAIEKLTHPDQFKYFPMSNKQKRELHQLGATVMLIRRSSFSLNIIKWLFLCSLTEECIAPPGAVAQCQSGLMGLLKLLMRRQCHRYDQSAVNLIFYSTLANYTDKMDLEILDKYVKIEREKTWNKPIHSLNNC